MLAALASYQRNLEQVREEECDSDEFSEIQDDVQYLERFLALVQLEISGFEAKGPSLRPFPQDDSQD